jgi:Rod binding domain-containing protein
VDFDSIDSLSGLGNSVTAGLEQTGSSGRTLEATADAAVGASDEKKKELAKDFESVFIAKLFDQVKESIGATAFDEEEEGTSEQVHGLFWLYLAEDVGRRGGFGLWRDIYRSFQELDGEQPSSGRIDKEL